MHDSLPGGKVSFPSGGAAAERVREMIPLVIAHASGLLTGPAPARAARAGLRHPGSLLGHHELRALIGFAEPAGLTTAVLHSITPAEDLWANDGQASQPQQHRQMEER
jgi:hypothetical protein